MIKKTNMEVRVWETNRDAWIAVKGNAKTNVFRSVAVTAIVTDATGTSATMTAGISSGF